MLYFNGCASSICAVTCCHSAAEKLPEKKVPLLDQTPNLSGLCFLQEAASYFYAWMNVSLE